MNFDLSSLFRFTNDERELESTQQSKQDKISTDVSSKEESSIEKTF